MEFTAREDIEAPLDEVFAAIADFDAIERAAAKRGVEVERKGGAGAVAVGTRWETAFPFRGRQREATVTLTQYDPPRAMSFDTVSSGLRAQTRVEAVALSRSQTRVSVVILLQPKTLSARLLVQSMKLARANLTRKFQLRAADYARDLENRLKRSA